MQRRKSGHLRRDKRLKANSMRYYFRVEGITKLGGYWTVHRANEIHVDELSLAKAWTRAGMVACELSQDSRFEVRSIIYIPPVD